MADLLFETMASLNQTLQALFGPAPGGPRVAPAANGNFMPAAWQPVAVPPEAAAAAGQLLSATSGLATDEEAIQGTLADKSPEEMEAIRAAFARQTCGDDLDEVLAQERRAAPLPVDPAAQAASIAVQALMAGHDAMAAAGIEGPASSYLFNMTPELREAALASLPEGERTRALEIVAARTGAEASSIGGALAGMRDLIAGGAAVPTVERVQGDLLVQLEKIPEHQQAEILAQLSPEDRAVAGSGLAAIAEAKKAEEAVKDTAASSTATLIGGMLAGHDALAGAGLDSPATAFLFNLAPEQRDAALAKMPADERARADGILAVKAEEAASALAGSLSGLRQVEQIQRGAGIDCADLQGQAAKTALSNLPEHQREVVLAQLSEEDRAVAEGAMAALAADEGQRKAGVAAMQTVASSRDPDPDQIKAALDLIPLSERDKALAEMGDEARKVAGQAIAVRTADLTRAAEALFKATEGSMLDPTDEGVIRRELATRSPAEIEELKQLYGRMNMDEDDRERSLEADLLGEFADNERLDRQFLGAVFSGNTTEQKAIALQLAAHHSGTDEELIYKTLRSITNPEERQRVTDLFATRQDDAATRYATDERGIRTVEDMLVDEMLEEDDASDVERDDYNYNRSMALLAGKLDLAKGVQADQYIDGSNEEGLAGLLEGCRNQDERDRVVGAWSEDIAGGADFAATIDTRFDDDEDAANSYDDADKNLILGALHGETARVRAARWVLGAEGWGTAEEKMVDQFITLDKDGKKVNPAAIQAEIEKYGAGTFQKIIDDEAEGVQKDALEQAGTGAVKPETGMAMATCGGSWDIDVLKQHMTKNAATGELYSAEEMKAILPGFCTEAGFPADQLDLAIEYGLGGRDAFKFRQLLKGEPKTFAEKMSRLRDEHDFNRGGGATGFGKAMTDSFSDAGAAEDAQMRKLEAAYAEIGPRVEEIEGKLAGLDGTPEAQVERARLLTEKSALTTEFDERSGYFGANTRNYQAAQDSVTSDLAMIGSSIVGGLATVLTGGWAGPLVGALMGGATNMVTKEAMLGDAYNAHDLGKDMISTAASSLAALATAGLAGKLGGLASGAGRLVGGGVIGQVVGAGMKGGLNAGLSSLITGTATQLTSDEVMQGKVSIGSALGKVAWGTLASFGSGAVSGAVGKGLDLGGLQQADVLNTRFTDLSNIGNKVLSSGAGELAGMAIDPSTRDGDDFFGRYLGKMATSMPGTLIGALGDARATRSELAEIHQELVEAGKIAPMAYVNPSKDPWIREMVAARVTEKAALAEAARLKAKNNPFGIKLDAADLDIAGHEQYGPPRDELGDPSSPMIYAKPASPAVRADVDDAVSPPPMIYAELVSAIDQIEAALLAAGHDPDELLLGG